MQNYPRITLEAARVNAHLSQKVAAQKLDISPETLRRYENGTSSPNWDMVKKMEKLYGFSMDYIFLPDTSLKAK